MKKILLAAALCATSLTAVAEVAMTDSYVQLNAGYALGTKAGNNFNGKKMKNAGVVGVEAGYRFTENFRTSLSLDFVPNAKYNGSVTGVNGQITNTPDSGDATTSPVTAANVTSSSVKVKSYSAMLNLYYDFGDFNGFTPYVTAGVGIAKNKTKSSTYNAAGGEFVDPEGLSDNTYTVASSTGTIGGASKTNFAWKLGLGTRYAVNNAVDLDLRYQFVNLGKYKTAGANNSATVNTATTIADTTTTAAATSGPLTGKLKEHQFLVGVAYKF